MISKLKILKINELFQKKVEGKAMFYAMFLTLIFGILSSVVLLSFFSFENAHLGHKTVRDQIKHLNAGIHWLLAHEDETVEKQKISLFGEDWLPIELKKSNWGLLQVGFVNYIDEMSAVPDSIARQFFIGYTDQPQMKTSLYLSDQGKPLKLAGQASLQGEAKIPKAGIATGYVDGVGFQGSILHEGQSSFSTAQLPKIDHGKLQEIYKLSHSITEQMELHDGMELNRSFGEATILLTTSSAKLMNVSLRGNILLHSSNALFIDASCQLEGVILIAPKITFATGFKGNVQAFATSEIVVNEDVILGDPSVLGVYTKEVNQEDPARIELREQAEVEGLVFIANRKYSRTAPEIYIEPHAKVTGQLYCDGLLHHAGEVIGNVTVKKFRLKTKSATFDNYILHGKIKSGNFKEYCVPNIFETPSEKLGVLKWLE